MGTTATFLPLLCRVVRERFKVLVLVLFSDPNKVRRFKPLQIIYHYQLNKLSIILLSIQTIYHYLLCLEFGKKFFFIRSLSTQ